MDKTITINLDQLVHKRCLAAQVVNYAAEKHALPPCGYIGNDHHQPGMDVKVAIYLDEIQAVIGNEHIIAFECGKRHGSV